MTADLQTAEDVADRARELAVIAAALREMLGPERLGRIIEVAAVSIALKPHTPAEIRRMCAASLGMAESEIEAEARRWAERDPEAARAALLRADARLARLLS